MCPEIFLTYILITRGVATTKHRCVNEIELSQFEHQWKNGVACPGKACQQFTGVVIQRNNEKESELQEIDLDDPVKKTTLSSMRWKTLGWVGFVTTLSSLFGVVGLRVYNNWQVVSPKLGMPSIGAFLFFGWVRKLTKKI